MFERIEVFPAGRQWVIKHRNSVLGYADSAEEAALLGAHLVEYIEERGRRAELVFSEPRSFS